MSSDTLHSMGAVHTAAYTADGAAVVHYGRHGGLNQRYWLHAPIFMADANLVMDVGGGLSAPNASLILFPLHQAANQVFRIEREPTGRCRIVAPDGRVLDVSGASRQEGAAVILWQRLDQDNQRFRLEPAGDGTFHLVAQHSQMLLQPADGPTARGAALVQAARSGAPNQRWRLHPLLA